jgi:hypothetical protein
MCDSGQRPPSWEAAVAANPKAVGYIEKSAVDASVKVVLAVN